MKEPLVPLKEIIAIIDANISTCKEAELSHKERDDWQAAVVVQAERIGLGMLKQELIENYGIYA